MDDLSSTEGRSAPRLNLPLSDDLSITQPRTRHDSGVHTISNGAGTNPTSMTSLQNDLEGQISPPQPFRLGDSREEVGSDTQSLGGQDQGQGQSFRGVRRSYSNIDLGRQISVTSRSSAEEEELPVSRAKRMKSVKNE